MTAIRRYVKKPVEIEATQWDGTPAGATPIINWILGSGGTARLACIDDPCSDDRVGGHTIDIDTLEGTMHTSAHDYVIKGIGGEFYPCKPGIFADSYDEPR